MWEIQIQPGEKSGKFKFNKEILRGPLLLSNKHPNLSGACHKDDLLQQEGGYPGATFPHLTFWKSLLEQMEKLLSNLHKNRTILDPEKADFASSLQGTLFLGCPTIPELYRNRT
jgi:hypothetical protein